VFNHKSPVTGEPGSVTAGNAPGVNDGATAVMLMSREKADALGLKPLFTIVDYAEVSQQTKDIATVPGLSIKKVLDQNGLTAKDIKLVEANEAFASQSIAVVRDLGLDPSVVNVNGGAIALGHPIGASGARILTTLLYEMQKRDVRTGLATLCIGGGMGTSLIVERSGL